MAVQGERLSFHRIWLARAGIGLWVLVVTLLGFSGLSTMLTPVDRPSTAANARSTDPAQIGAAWGKLPLSFIPNHGQTDPAVLFYVKGAGHTIFFTRDEVVFSAVQQTEDESVTSVVRLRFAGANPNPAIEGVDRLPGIANFFLGDDPSRWRTGVPTYGAVAYRELYPGIDLVYRGTEGHLKSEFLVSPGARPEMIRQVYSGVEALSLRQDGALVLQTALGELIEERPVIYQEIDGQRVKVEGGYRLLGNVQVGFEVGAYNLSHPLVIDPTLTYSTYLGGSANDIGYGIAVDSSGNAYVTGSTASSSDFPTTTGPTYGGGTTDAFVTKLNPAGSALTYATYLGGNGSDSGRSIAVDGSGNACVTGQTNSSTNFPTVNPSQGTYGGGTNDAFVTKLNADGSTLTYSTYLGGSGSDNGLGIAVDGPGNAHVTGQTTSSTDFPTVNPSQGTYGGGSNDAFVTKLTATGAITYSTYLGGGSSESGNGIGVDSSGNAYVTGETNSPDFPTASPWQTANAGGFDAFVTKLTATGAITYSTYLGGSGDDSSRGIAVDSSGNVYVTGKTSSIDFPTASPFQDANGGASDAFVTKLNTDGSALTYSTYLGGSGTDESYGIAIALAGSPGNAFVTGFTLSTNDFPMTSPYQDTFGGSTDAFVTEFKADGSSLMYSTYLGGSNDDFGYSIAVTSTASAISAFATGSTNSITFPTKSALQSANAGFTDAFVTRIPFSGPTAVTLSSFTAYSGQRVPQAKPVMDVLSHWPLAALGGLGLAAMGASIVILRRRRVD